jgi:hypothetical protein
VGASGSIVNNGSIDVKGTYTLTAGATGTNNGKVNIGNGAELHAGLGVRFDGTGTNEVTSGGAAFFDDDTVPFIGGASAKFNLTVGTFTFNNDQYILNGEAELNDLDSTATWPVDTYINAVTSAQLIINSGAELTVPAGGVLGLAGSTSAATAPVVGDLTGGGAAPKIIFTSTGCGWFSSSSTYKNFYDSSYSGSEGGGEDPVAGATYEWKANAGNTGSAGWER